VDVGKGPDGAGVPLAVTFVPEFDVGELGVRCEQAKTLFVLDCSGSMQGQSLAQATAALELCLRSLNEGDTFNVCQFGSRYEMLSDRAAALRRAHTAGGGEVGAMRVATWAGRRDPRAATGDPG